MTLELKLPAPTNRYCGVCLKSTSRIRKLKGEICGQCRKFFPFDTDPYPSYNLTIRIETDK